MRIITGEWRGRKLPRPDRGVRPTPDRVKEALFSILYSRGLDFSSTKWLDLFCGCGSIGLEALSRGAPFVGFVDESRKGLAAIEAFLKLVGGQDRAMLVQAKLPGQFALLSRLDAAGPFDVVFADPPFTEPLHPAVFLQDPIAERLVAQDGLVVWEQEAYQEKYDQIPGWTVVDMREYSRIRLWLYQRQS